MEILLDGLWRARSDPHNIGWKDGWAKEVWPEEKVFYLAVPGFWQTQRWDLKGAVWYERSFLAESDWNNSY